MENEIENEIKCEMKSNKGLYFLAALLTALAITGGVFAYTATTDTVGLALTAQGEFASVTANTTGVTGWNVFGNYKGKTNTGEVFEITPATGFTGDLSATIMLANSADLVSAYKVLMLTIKIYSDNGAGSANLTDQIGTTGYLSLGKGEVNIDLAAGSPTPYHVLIDSGFYNTFRSWAASKEDITLLLDVAQKGA